jgi:uncharacterized protein (TIGR00730 family)
MSELKRICVFCGSSTGTRPEYKAAAREMGGLLAGRRIGLVFGGGNRGLMGELADAALQGGGEVIGVIPRQLEELELAHQGLTELRVVESMHDRKALMADLSDAFIGLPGGLGTMEEFFEVSTWSQLGIHSKPLGLLNACGYFNLVRHFFYHAVTEGFLQEAHVSQILIRSKPDELLTALHTYQPATVTKASLDPQNR